MSPIDRSRPGGWVRQPRRGWLLRWEMDEAWASRQWRPRCRPRSFASACGRLAPADSHRGGRRPRCGLPSRRSPPTRLPFASIPKKGRCEALSSGSHERPAWRARAWPQTVTLPPWTVRLGLIRASRAADDRAQPSRADANPAPAFAGSVQRRRCDPLWLAAGGEAVLDERGELPLLAERQVGWGDLGSRHRLGRGDRRRHEHRLDQRLRGLCCQSR